MLSLSPRARTRPDPEAPEPMLYDKLHHAWHSDTTRRISAWILVLTFLGGLALIELERQGWLPFKGHLPTNHFYAVVWALTVLLAFEVLDLVFSLSGSVSRSAGKQLEVFSLVLLRKSFAELKSMPEPISLDSFSEPVRHMAADAGGALVIFALVGVYYQLQKHVPISEDDHERASFGAAKKKIALALLLAFFGLAVVDVVRSLTGSPHQGQFFEVFYTLLIFTDVLIALVSIRYSIAYHVVFRYFGLAVVTMFIRLALASPSYLNALLGVGAAAYAVLLTLAVNRAVSRGRPPEEAHPNP